MRIISGKFKGKKILLPKDRLTRPLKDIAKESIFNILNHSTKLKFSFQNSNILDLFSGVGSFGIECISRGAQFVTFVEKYELAILILKKNLKNLKSVNNYKIIQKDIFLDFKLEILNQKFDLVFLDPPYKEKKIYNILIDILKDNIIKKEGIIVIHRHKKDNDQLPTQLKIVEEKKYGISKVIYCIIESN